MTTLHAPPDLASDASAASLASQFSTAVLANGLALVLTGLFAGFFGTYSVSVVRGLAIVDDSTYVTSFQAINATIRSAEFAIVFFGTLPAIGFAIGASRSGGTEAALRIGAAVFVLATIAITFLGNVPLNNDLAQVNALDGAAATAARTSFETTWNQLNLARTATSAAAFMALAASVLMSSNH
jgi:uncharacterized membrane protein